MSPGGGLVAVRCPVCAAGIDAAPRACPRCATPHHPECWDYVGDCAIFGCAARGHGVAAAVAGAAGSPWLLGLWFRIFRLQWRLFLVTTLLIAVELAFAPLFLIALSLEVMVPRVLVMAAMVVLVPVWVLAVLGPIVLVLAPVTYLLLFLPELGLRTWLEGTHGAHLSAGPKDAMRVAARLEGFGPEAAGRSRFGLDRLIAVVEYVSMANIGLLGLVLLCMAPALVQAPEIGLLWLVVWGFGFVLVPRGLAAAIVHSRDARGLHIATLQNRLVASAKERALPRP